MQSPFQELELVEFLNSVKLLVLLHGLCLFFFLYKQKEKFLTEKNNIRMSLKGVSLFVYWVLEFVCWVGICKSLSIYSSPKTATVSCALTEFTKKFKNLVDKL